MRTNESGIRKMGVNPIVEEIAMVTNASPLDLDSIATFLLRMALRQFEEKYPGVPAEFPEHWGQDTRDALVNIVNELEERCKFRIRTRQQHPGKRPCNG